MNSNKLNNDEKYYKGSCETTFEKWFANHKKSLHNEQNKNETEFSKEVWHLKSTNNNAEIVNVTFFLTRYARLNVNKKNKFLFVTKILVAFHNLLQQFTSMYILYNIQFVL